MTEIEHARMILSDCGNFALVVFGFSATLFAVLYSFILMERDKLIEISERIKNSTKTNPQLFANESVVSKRLNTYKTLNRKVLISIYIHFILFISTMVFKYTKVSHEALKYAVITIVVLTGLIALYVLFLIVKTTITYLKTIKT